MSKCPSRCLSVIAAMVLVSGTAIAAEPAKAAQAKPAAPRFVERPGSHEFSGELTVRPRQDLAGSRSNQARARLDGLIQDFYPEVDEYTIRIPDGYGAKGVAENRFAAELLATGDYEYVHPNWICYPVETPNDPLFTSQWHHQIIESQAAWNLLIGTPSVTVAVTDTGALLSHPDLTNRVLGFNAVDDLAEIDGGQVNDLNGHGTHVSGCAASAANNGVGVVGTGWGLSVMMIRVSNSSGGGAYLDDITQGARWAIEHGAVSASSSYTGVQDATIQTSGAYIRSLGGIYLYAADNYNQNHASWDHPDVIVVGASDEVDAKAGFSSYGLGVDLFAPGVNILSSTVDGAYGYASGTSMATPVCNGVVGMMFMANPSLTPEHLESLLERTCVDWGTPGEDSTYGFGRINMRRAVEAALASNGPSAPLVEGESTHCNAGATILIDVLGNDVDPNLDPISIQGLIGASTLGGLVSLSVGTGPNGRNQIAYTAPASGGLDSFSYEVSDGSSSASATVKIAVNDPAGRRFPENPANTLPGLTGRYFGLNSLSMLPNFNWLPPYAPVNPSNLNYASSGGNFATSGRSENVGASYVGYVNVPTDGTYTFSTASDDGSRLFIGDRLLVNNDFLHGMTTVSGPIALRAGKHKIRVDFFERGGDAGLIASISGPGIANQPIPASMLSRLCLSDLTGEGDVDIIDFLEFMDAFAACDGSDAPCFSNGINPDVNGDGLVDILDFLEYIGAFGDGC